MPRPRSAKVKEVKAKLLARLGDGLHRPGSRFLSNRAIAMQFCISYQTAHRLVSELVAEGKLQRRAASGTYLPGRRVNRTAAQLIFHARGRQQGSFGSRLLGELTAALAKEKIAWGIRWVDDGAPVQPPPAETLFPVIWDCPGAMAGCIAVRRSALLLNDRPPPGLASVFVDSVSTDDYSGGVCAAELLSRRGGQTARFAVLSGPRDDRRSGDRVAGFLSVLKSAVIPSPSWFFEGGLQVAAAAVHKGRHGIFCCNDRLAEAVISYCQKRRIDRPPLVGFDDAPVAERLNLTTIAIPWEELVKGAVAVIKRRMADDSATASRQIFAPRPVIRGSNPRDT